MNYFITSDDIKDSNRKRLFKFAEYIENEGKSLDFRTNTKSLKGKGLRTPTSHNPLLKRQIAANVV